MVLSMYWTRLMRQAVVTEALIYKTIKKTSTDKIQLNVLTLKSFFYDEGGVLAFDKVMCHQIVSNKAFLLRQNQHDVPLRIRGFCVLI